MSPPQPIGFRCPVCGERRVNPEAQHTKDESGDVVFAQIVNGVTMKTCQKCATMDGVVVAHRWPIADRWRALSDDERLTLMSMCCRHCGTLKLPCYCGPEYDR